jgi:hypothetical protein
MLLLIVANRTWPDAVDRSIIFGYLSVVMGVVVAGYVLAYIDWRASYRRLRRALVLIYKYPRMLPDWALRDRPRCLQVFGLTMPFTMAELLAAYRELVKQTHPDRGGDRKRFLELQQFFEQAQTLAEDYNEGG